MRRLAYLVGSLLALVLLATGEAGSKPMAVSFTGSWTDDYTVNPSTQYTTFPSPWILVQTGSSVCISYTGSGGGKGSGTVSGLTLTGSSNDSYGTSTFTLTLAPDGRSAQGTWKRDNLSGNLKWTRTGPAPASSCGPAAAPQSIAVKSLVGEVRFRRAGVSRPLQPGDKLQEGDFLSTDFNSHVVLEVGNGARVTMGESTQVRVNSMFFSADTSKLQLYLKLGQIETVAPDNPTIHDDFSVVAPTATASIRGTRFSVRYAKTGVTTVRAIVHSVRVTPANRSLKPVTLLAGHQVTVTKRKVGPVTKIH